MERRWNPGHHRTTRRHPETGKPGSAIIPGSFQDHQPGGPELGIRHKTKEAEAKAHVKQAALLSQRTRNLLTYTDGSMLGNSVGAGVHISPESNQPAIENTYPLGTQMEVYDEELYGIIVLHRLNASMIKQKKKTQKSNVWYIKRIKHPIYSLF